MIHNIRLSRHNVCITYGIIISSLPRRTSATGAGRFGPGSFGRWSFGMRNPWPKAVIKLILRANCETYYFRQSNFYLRQHHIHQDKLYLIRIPFIYPVSVSVKEGLFS